MSDQSTPIPFSEVLGVAIREQNAPFETHYALYRLSLGYLKMLAEKVETLEQSVEDLRKRLANT